MTHARTLHVRCTTWEQVDVFTTRKLRKGKLLSMKVPFETTAGAPLTLGLELPNQLVVAIDGVVQRASAIEPEPGMKPDQAHRTWIEIELTGLTDDVMNRIQAMASEELASPANPTTPPALRRAPASVVDDLPADERELFRHLSGELRRMRSAAVHDVLGVAVDADAAQVRASWKNLLRRHHPDLVARRGAPAITHLAEELTILSNRAYDRLRAALVAEGRGTIIGPTLSAPPGWLVGFEDIGSASVVVQPPRVAHRADAAPTPPTSPIVAPAKAQGGDAFETRARAMLATGDAENAREVLAAALVVYPRSRSLRALYLVATAVVAVLRGEVMLAISQLETALAHHDQSVEAAMLLEHVKKHGAARPEQMRRVFG